MMLVCSVVCAQQDATLRIGEKSWSLPELLKRADLEDITVRNDPAYGGREMHYRAIRASKLFEDTRIRQDEVIEFRCLDGFSAPISKDRILSNSPTQSVAYIAIEDPASKWPDLPTKDHSGSAGPFYLVWVNPERSGITQDEWPFKLMAFDVKGRLQDLYPKMFPAARDDMHVERGFLLFQKTCFACHSINGQGASKVGPDLNIPMNPTEYFKEEILSRYIRDPKSVRTWEGSRMPGFDRQTFSDQDISDVIAYLKSMATDRPPSP